MAKPRVFVSSTYFDLKSVRADLEYFIREQGFDPVLHERGSVPYGREEALEHYCYKEIGTCDILISVIGGRFGSKSEDTSYSVSQLELRVALELSKQVYVFVDREVYHEYRTYERNKSEKIKWASVDDARVFLFIDEIYKLKNNNPIQPFETSSHITSYLRDQWAGLFQRLLAQSSLDTQANMFLELKHSLETARTLVDVISSRSDAKDEIVSDLVFTNHPLFGVLRKLLSIPYRLLFYDIDELTKWIEARSFRKEDFLFDDSIYEWIYEDKKRGKIHTLQIKKTLFDDQGRLKPMKNQNWSDDFVSYDVASIKKSDPFDSTLDDDVPF